MSNAKHTNNASKPDTKIDANTNQPIRKLKLRQLFTLKPSQWLLAWAVGLVTLIATVGLLSVSGWFISAAGLAGLLALLATGASAISFDFFRPAAVIRAFAITRTAGRYGERLASHHAVLGLLTDLRCLFFSAITKQKLTAVNDLVQSADTMQRLTHDIDQLDELPLRFWSPWLWALALQGVLLAFMALFSPKLVMIVALPLLCAGVVIPFVGILLGKKIAHQHTVLAEKRRRDLLNPLTASTSLILWQKWQDYQTQFYQSDVAYNQLHLRQRGMGILLNTLQQICLAVMILLLIWQGYPLVDSGSLSLPLLLAYVLAVLGMYEIILPLASSYTAYGFALASKQRLNVLLEPETPNKQPTQSKPLQTLPIQTKQPFPEGKLTLTAKQLTAKFPNALTGVDSCNFEISTGEVLFIKGHSGAGKSTLLTVLADELPLNSGSLTLNGVPLANININTTNIDTSNIDTSISSNSHIGYLAQQLDIFDLTLAQNLRVGHMSATDAELWQALEKVKLAEWAKQQPQQLNTPLGEYGTAISGGQARRIALARLLLQPKKILLLDEPFAGLDADSATHVYQALKQQQQAGILMIVSHHFMPDIQSDISDLNKEDVQVLSLALNVNASH